MRTAQQLFDESINHLRLQGKKSAGQIEWDGTVRCAYLADDGCKCAIGVFITAEAYLPELEGKTVKRLIDDKLLPDELHNELSPHLDLLRELQSAHDLVPVEEWEERFQMVAKKHNLIYSPKE